MPELPKKQSHPPKMNNAVIPTKRSRRTMARDYGRHDWTTPPITGQRRHASGHRQTYKNDPNNPNNNQHHIQK